MTYLTGNSLVEKRKFDILDRGFERDEIERLENEAYHVVAIVGSLGLREILDKFAIEPLFTAVIVVKYAKNIQERGFT